MNRCCVFTHCDCVVHYELMIFVGTNLGNRFVNEHYYLSRIDGVGTFLICGSVRNYE